VESEVTNGIKSYPLKEAMFMETLVRIILMEKGEDFINTVREASGEAVDEFLARRTH
jgi:hypothetical protein